MAVNTVLNKAKDDAGQTVRTLKRVRLFDVSPVTYPAYTGTDVAVRAMSAGRQEIVAQRRGNLLKALGEAARALI